jgi:hypothetical protein
MEILCRVEDVHVYKMVLDGRNIMRRGAILDQCRHLHNSGRPVAEQLRRRHADRIVCKWRAKKPCMPDNVSMSETPVKE